MREVLTTLNVLLSIMEGMARDKIQTFKNHFQKWLVHGNITNWCKYDIESFVQPHGWQSFRNLFYVHFCGQLSLI